MKNEDDVEDAVGLYLLYIFTISFLSRMDFVPDSCVTCLQICRLSQSRIGPKQCTRSWLATFERSQCWQALEQTEDMLAMATGFAWILQVMPSPVLKFCIFVKYF